MKKYSFAMFLILGIVFSAKTHAQVSESLSYAGVRNLTALSGYIQQFNLVAAEASDRSGKSENLAMAEKTVSAKAIKNFSTYFKGTQASWMVGKQALLALFYQ